MKTKKLIDNIVKWLQDILKNTGASGYVVGISGGIDSAVCANLIKYASPRNHLGVIIPISSSNESLTDATKLTESNDIDSITVDLTDIHKNMLQNILDSMGSLKRKETIKIADANLRARLRMSCLYTISNNLNYLVIGTDNLDEYFTGYFTKFGDGASDLMPLAKIHKSEVYKMARYFEVPESILIKAPSADLWEGQTDENEMGVSYEDIESFIKGIDVNEESARKIQSMHKGSMHKRSTPPIFNL